MIIHTASRELEVIRAHLQSDLQHTKDWSTFVNTRSVIAGLNDSTHRISQLYMVSQACSACERYLPACDALGWTAFRSSLRVPIKMNRSTENERFCDWQGRRSRPSEDGRWSLTPSRRRISRLNAESFCVGALRFTHTHNTTIHEGQYNTAPAINRHPPGNGRGRERLLPEPFAGFKRKGPNLGRVRDDH